MKGRKGREREGGRERGKVHTHFFHSVLYSPSISAASKKKKSSQCANGWDKGDKRAGRGKWRMKDRIYYSRATWIDSFVN